MLDKNKQSRRRILLIVGIVTFVVLILIGVLWFGRKVDQKKSNQSSDPYLTIAEWGVRIPLPEGNRDMYYKIVTYQGNTGQGAKIYSKDIDDLKNANNVSCRDDQYPLFIINRVSASRGLQMNQPDLPLYDPTSGPYKVYDFQTNYAFGPSKESQDLPRCVNLNAGTDQPFKGDKAVSDQYQAKQEVLSNAYNGLQAIPATDAKSK